MRQLPEFCVNAGTDLPSEYSPSRSRSYERIECKADGFFSRCKFRNESCICLGGRERIIELARNPPPLPVLWIWNHAKSRRIKLKLEISDIRREWILLKYMKLECFHRKKNLDDLLVHYLWFLIVSYLKYIYMSQPKKEMKNILTFNTFYVSIILSINESFKWKIIFSDSSHRSIHFFHLTKRERWSREAGYSKPRIPERTLGWRITLARIHTRFMHTWTYLTVATAYTRRRLRGRER